MRTIRIDGLAYPARSTHDVVFRVETANDDREVLINPSTKTIAQKGAGVGMIYNKVTQ
jgi:hypothetical protein